jgi:uncharacterized membrane protein YcaP (DUF421 family)
MNALSSLLGLGLQPNELTLLQITLRGVIVFISALVMVRLSDRRSLTKKNPFDQMLIVILASSLARAVNGSAAFFGTIGGAAIIVLLHRLLALVSCRWPAVATIIKGKPYVLLQNGKLEHAAMHRLHIGSSDIEEDLRLSAKKEDLEAVKVARLEASGDMSFILREQKA